MRTGGGKSLPQALVSSCEMDLEDATEVFVRAVAQLKSEFYPYSVELQGGIWVLKDDPPRKNPRTSEVVAVRGQPQEVVASIEDQRVGWHFLSQIVKNEAECKDLRIAYKQLGYRAHGTYRMFVHDLNEISSLNSSPPAKYIKDQDALERIPQQSAQKYKLRPCTRLFSVFDEHTDHGWVRSVPVGENSWVSGLYVRPNSRGKGFGQALMNELLRVDRESGVKASVLLASSAGARLYPHLGYEEIGVLLSFCPRDRTKFQDK